jgi:hypothetical protein
MQFKKSNGSTKRMLKSYGLNEQANYLKDLRSNKEGGTEKVF